MKKLLLIGSVVLALVLLLVGFTTPLFAHEPNDGGATPDNDKAWEAMHEACENGDWEAMIEAAEEFHGEDFDDMPYHSGEKYHHHWWDGMGGHMGGGWGGMM